MGALKTTEHAALAAPPSTPIITPAAMIQQALANNAGIEVMEKLLALQERYDAFQARKAFDDAMASLRGDMPTILKTQSADFGNGGAAYKYEDLSAVTEALSPIMATVGLSFRWRTQSTDRGVSVTCVITHRDGHAEETTLSAGFDTSGKKNPIQSLGSAVTYLQRYTLKAAVGVAAAKDDDGNSTVDDALRTPATQRTNKSAFDQAMEGIGAAKSETALREVWKRIESTSEDQINQQQHDALNDRCKERRAELAPGTARTYTPPQFDDFPGDMRA